MRRLSVFIVIVALFAIAIAYPASELEDNNQALIDANIDGVKHDTALREARQFGFGRYGGFGGGGFGRYGGFGGGGFGRYGGYGGFGGGGFGGFGGFGGGGYGGYYG